MATVTSKGQITIPKEVRDALRLQAGDRVLFRQREDGSYVLEPATRDIESLFGILKPKVRGVTVEQVNETVRRRGAGYDD